VESARIDLPFVSELISILVCHKIKVSLVDTRRCHQEPLMGQAGMFDKPVLLSTWLAAQENKTCNPQAKVSAYSIQPGSAYTPGWNGPYGTDPNYTATEATLIGYRNGVTC
jgi:hypothetical protein